MKGKRHTLGILVLAAVISTTTASLADGSNARSLRGGTYRVGWEYSFEGQGFDPTGESQLGTPGIYTLVVRTLVGYNHVAGSAGTVLVPDLATSVPTATNGGLTYTFTLKKGIKFGPPVNREITSQDIRYAIERLARPANSAWFSFYFTDIKGYSAYRAGKTHAIAGIATPNSRTIGFTLTRRNGAFPHLLTLPATGPIPREVASCFEGKPGRYGSDLVSSGPYMIDGADRIKTGSCRDIAPMRGISDRQLTLVRNPRYDPKTDSTAARENNPDRFVFIAYQGLGQTRSLAQIIAQLRAGALDDAFFTSTPKSLRAYAAAEQRKGLLRLNPADWDVFVNFNLTKPPFDDVHVRRAFAWGLDRTAMRETLGGALAGKIASHIIPDTLLGNRLEGYDPFKTAGDVGSLARARAEMAKSRYATKHGRCIARACKRVFYSPLVDTTFYAAGARMTPILEKTAAAIGITFANHARPYDRLFTPSNEIAMAPNVDWLKDFADPSSFVDHVFGGRYIDPVQNFDFPLVGLTPARARKLHVTGHVTGVPSVDADIGRCSALVGSPRLDCYAALDRKLTAQIVPLIPLVWRNRITVLGRQVAKWGYDQASGTTAFTHVAVRQ